jgi:glycosyltransferase involved in cell wall biosynthesis
MTNVKKIKLTKYDVEKIAVVCANTSWYIFNFRRSTIEMLVSDGWKVLTLAGDDEHASQLASLGANHHKVFLHSTGANPIVDFFSLIHFWWIYRNKPMVVLNFTPKCNIYSCLAAYIRGVPSINNISGMGSGILSKGPIGFIVRRLYGLVSRIAAMTYFQNSDDQDYFFEAFGLPCEKSILIPGSGVNLTQFKYAPLNTSSQVRFGMFTRIIEEKGVRHFVEAARLLKQSYSVEFVIAGSVDHGRNNAISIEEVKSWDSEGIITYLGMLSDVRPEIAACDCIVLPSYYPEGTPKILIESAAIGRPIITTDHPGCRDTVTEASGYLVQKKSTQSLTAAMEGFINLPKLEKDIMSINSRNHAEEYYDEEIVLLSYSDSINQLINI